jgi:hypothetical protein
MVGASLSFGVKFYPTNQHYDPIITMADAEAI